MFPTANQQLKTSSEKTLPEPSSRESEDRLARALGEIERLSDALHRSLTDQKRLQILIRGLGETLRETRDTDVEIEDELPRWYDGGDPNESVKESEARFRAATESGLDAFYVLKSIRNEQGEIVDFEIVDLNTRAAKLLSRSKETLLRQRITKVLPLSRTGPGVFQAYVRVTETGKPLEEEFAVDTPGSRAYWLKQQVVPIADGVAVTVRDVTSRKRVELREKTQSELNQALAQAQNLEDGIPCLLQVICENLGWAVGEIWIVESARGLLRCAGTFHLPAVEDSGGAPSQPVSFSLGEGLPGRVWASGSPEWILDTEEEPTYTRAPVAVPTAFQAAYGFPILAEGKIVGVMEFFSLDPKEPNEDLIQTMAQLGLQVGQFLGRKLAYKAVQESEEKYRTLFNGSPIPIFLFDASTLAIVDANGPAEEHYGYSRQELLSMSIRDIFAPRESNEGLGGADSESAPFQKSGLWRHRKKNGLTIEVVTWPHELTIAGQRVCVLVVTDMTEQRLLEEQLRQSQKMDAIGRLAGGVAHDFNNLLTAILGYGDLVGTGLPKDDPLQSHVREVLKAGQRAASLTQQLLAFSRKQIVVPRVLDLNSVVREVNKMLRRIIGEDIELRVLLDPATGNVKADPGQIEQVLLNLAVNARDAMPEGGRLIIETRNIRLDEAIRERFTVHPGPHIMLAVSDSGIGMDAETQSHIFEPFFTTKEAGKGTGLGLSTVYGIVKQNGGYIWVYSEPNAGTTFKIYFPRVDEAPDDASDAACGESDAQGGGETILLVEDEEAVRRLVHESLGRMGYTVLPAGGGQQALEIEEKHPDRIDLVITDVVMPGMNGRELASRLSARRAGIKVVYMSGYTNNVINSQGTLEVGTTLLEKPFTFTTLARTVRRALDERRPRESPPHN